MSFFLGHSVYASCVRKKKIRMLENYWDWNHSACRLEVAVCGGLDLLNVNMMQIESSNACRWRLRELDRQDAQRRPGGIVSERIWRVLACPMRMLRIGISGH